MWAADAENGVDAGPIGVGAPGRGSEGRPAMRQQSYAPDPPAVAPDDAAGPEDDPVPRDPASTRSTGTATAAPDSN